MAICSRGGGLAAVRENPPTGCRVVRYCSVCSAIWTIIFRRLAAKEHFTVSLGYRPATITDLKFSKLNKHGAHPRRLLPEIRNGRLVSLVARRVTR